MRAAIHWLDRISAFADRIALFGAVLSVAALVFLAGWQDAARAHDLFALTADAAEGRTNPVMRDFDCRMVSMYPTQGPVMRAFVDDMLAAEGKGGLLSLSLAHGFPYGDTERTGTRMLAIAHSDAELAQGAAERFGRRLWESREALRINWPDIPTALDRAKAAKAHPVVLADTGDNAGGGAPSDSTFVIKEVLARGMKDVALAVYWDPVLVDMCCDAGEGAQMRVRLGGKRSEGSGDAVDLEVTVRAIRHDMVQQFGDLPSPFGTGVWLEADGVHLVVNNSRTQCLHPSLFTDLGIDLATMQAMKDAEGKGGILSVSLTHGFPWADVADVGAKTLVIADGDAGKAADTAKAFADRLWDIREGLRMDYPDIGAALDIVEAAEDGPITLADMGDNAGGGAPADSTYFLQEILKRGMTDIAHGIFWGPVLVAMCQDAGVGARMRVRLGGKICAVSGQAVDLDVTVRAVRENMTQMLGETEMPLGTGVWLDADGVRLVVSSLRTQNFSPSAYTDLGIDISQMRALIPKSTNHFYQNFEKISSRVIHVRTPETVTPDMTIIPFTKRDGTYWPKVENPFA